jgi:hypothetical protein
VNNVCLLAAVHLAVNAAWSQEQKHPSFLKSCFGSQLNLQSHSQAVALNFCKTGSQLPAVRVHSQLHWLLAFGLKFLPFASHVGHPRQGQVLKSSFGLVPGIGHKVVGQTQQHLSVVPGHGPGALGKTHAFVGADVQLHSHLSPFMIGRAFNPHMFGSQPHSQLGN